MLKHVKSNSIFKIMFFMLIEVEVKIPPNQNVCVCVAYEISICDLNTFVEIEFKFFDIATI